MTTTPQTPTAAQSADQLFAEVYANLKRVAHARLAARPHDTLDTTELVHELFLRIGDNPALRFEQRAQFFAYAARAMRHLLLDRARDCMRLRAGGDWARMTLDSEDARLAIETAEQALALDQALRDLAGTDARAAHVLELRYFVGLSIDETAQALGVAPRSVDRDWRFARAFLHDALGQT
jgi:RNA polymerase sigma factor (TIGR02999 family)